MNIVIENCSSPGASFTQNTDSVILKCYNWIQEHPNCKKSFREFRFDLQKEKGINDNNARNIYPFLKNCGFIRYNRNEIMDYDYFFTNTGLAYVKVLEAIELLKDEGLDTVEKKKAHEKLIVIKQDIIMEGLKKLLKVPDSNYKMEYIACIKFLLKFRSINKIEFAYLLYEKNLDAISYLDNMEENISSYRSGDIDIEVSISVRNDIALRKKTGQERRMEKISFLTAYTYILGSLNQGGIVDKSKNDFILNENKRIWLEELLKEVF